jgi:hypothetical protein
MKAASVLIIGSRAPTACARMTSTIKPGGCENDLDDGSARAILARKV